MKIKIIKVITKDCSGWRQWLDSSSDGKTSTSINTFHFYIVRKYFWEKQSLKDILQGGASDLSRTGSVAGGLGGIVSGGFLKLGYIPVSQVMVVIPCFTCVSFMFDFSNISVILIWYTFTGCGSMWRKSQVKFLPSSILKFSIFILFPLLQDQIQK